MRSLFILVSLIATMFFATSAFATASGYWKAVGFMQLASQNASAVTFLPYNDSPEFTSKANCDGFVNGANLYDPINNLKGVRLKFKLDATCLFVAVPEVPAP